MWQILEDLAPANHYISIRYCVRLPAGVSEDRVLASLGTLIGRHEALRTRFLPGPAGEPVQWVDPGGDLTVDICETAPELAEEVAWREAERLWGRPFDHEREWPLRGCLVTADGQPRHLAFALSHLAVDAVGLLLLRDRLLAALEEPDGNADSTVEGWQPRERAEFESSPTGQRLGERSLDYWREVMRMTPRSALAGLPGPAEQPRYPGFEIDSVALAAAAHTIAERHRVSPSTVLLATAASLIGVRSGSDTVPLLLASSNRFTARDRTSVSTLYQASPVLLTLDGDSLSENIRRSHEASTLAYLRGQSDPRAVTALLRSINTARGIDIDMSCTVNVMPEPDPGSESVGVVGPAGLDRMAELTRVSDLPGRDTEQLKIYLHVLELRSRALLELFCDSRYLPAAEARRFLTGLERVLVAMVADRDLNRARLAELTGITPLPRSESFVEIDNCWVDLIETEHLVSKLPGVSTCAVFASADDGETTRLTAYVQARPGTTPNLLHEALMSALKAHPTVMAPHRYVLCRTAPGQPDHHAGWRRQPVVADGNGRPGS